MTRVLIVYHSVSGNTKKMAEIIGSAIEDEGVSITLKTAEEAKPEDMLAADGIVVGSPVYYGSMAAELKELFDKSVSVHGKLDGKIGGAFATAANSGYETTIRNIHDAMLVHGMIIQGDPEKYHYGPVSINEPAEADEEYARRFGKRFANLTIMGCGWK